MVPITYFTLIFLLSILDLKLKVNNCAPVIQQENLHKNGLSSLLSTLKKTPEALIRFQCPEGWQRFGGSCYSLPNIKSTANKANDTCHLHFNQSQLMQIRHPIEFIYAADILGRSHIPGLIVEIDPQLLKGDSPVDILSSTDLIKWNQADDSFRQAQDAYYQSKMKTSARLSNEKNLYQTNQVYNTSNIQTKLQLLPYTIQIGNETNNIYLSEDDKKFAQIEDIHRLCQHLERNVLQNDSHVFLLTAFLLVDKPVCALSNVDSSVAYDHTCQYVLDYCFDNDKCGKHGRCVNTPTGFKCLCAFPFNGLYCQTRPIETFGYIIASIIIVILRLYIHWHTLKKFWFILKKYSNICKTQLLKLCDKHNSKNNTINTVADSSLSNNQLNKYNLIRWYWCGGLSIFIIIIPIISTIYHLLSFSLNQVDTVNQNRNVCRSHNYIFQMIIFACRLIVFITICLILLAKQQRKLGNTLCELAQLLLLRKRFTIVSRYETPAVLAIFIREALAGLDYILVDISELWSHGVLDKLLKRLVIFIYTMIKYYPLLISLRQKNIIIRCLAAIFSVMDFVIIFIQEISCMDFLTMSPKIFNETQVEHHLKFGRWAIGYTLIKNLPYFILLAYITAELIVRFVYDSLYTDDKESRKFWILSVVSTANSNIANDSVSDSSGSVMQEKYGHIYPWDTKSLFTTISICIYTVSFIFLYYLTCTFIFNSMVGNSSYMSFLLNLFKSWFELDLKEYSFHFSIILSGLITNIILVYQLFIGMKKYKKTITLMVQDTNGTKSAISRRINNSFNLEFAKHIAKAFLCIYGVFLILFHLILSCLIVTHLSFVQIGLIQPIFSFVLSLFIWHELPKSIIEAVKKFCSGQLSETKRTWKNIIMYIFYIICMGFVFITSVHVGIANCVVYFIKLCLIHIISMTQIDCSCLEQSSNTVECAANESGEITEPATTLDENHVTETPDTCSTLPIQPIGCNCESSLHNSRRSSDLPERIFCSPDLDVPLLPDWAPPDASIPMSKSSHPHNDHRIETPSNDDDDHFPQLESPLERTQKDDAPKLLPMNNFTKKQKFYDPLIYSTDV